MLRTPNGAADGYVLQRRHMIKVLVAVITIMLTTWALHAAEYHVSPSGLDSNEGSNSKPFKTISAAARIAQPGDVITVHEGTYRERVNPPRGGTSDGKRIVYQAAPGEKVVIKGSKVVTGWEKLQNDTWQTVIPNSFFSEFNPYSDLIHGDWFKSKGREHHTGSVYLNGHWLIEAPKLEAVLKPADKAAKDLLWFAKVDENNTTIWAQFKGVDPNEELVEVNARQTVFYPDKPGRNYITVRGFTLEHAATPWAPPTAEQIGLIGTHWSKGWIIENNTIRYSTCVGVTLGKYGDEWDNRSQSAGAYNQTIQRALTNGWSKVDIGNHVVRDNHISHCEQAGIVGSLGAVFSTISGNHIHDIHVRSLFSGAEMAGIKIHASIDMLISDNYIHNCYRGIWLDWMAQGARVTRNLLHDNHPSSDLFMEVNHGPFLVDNNIFLSRRFLRDWSWGGAYVHNLAAGSFQVRPQGRKTPYHKAHSTELAGRHDIKCGDNRFFNNILVEGHNLSAYNKYADSMTIKGNVFVDSKAVLIKKEEGLYLELDLDKPLFGNEERRLVTTELLGRAKIPDLPFEQPDGTPYRLDRDYFGAMRDAKNPAPGPFRIRRGVDISLKVWPRK